MTDTLERMRLGNPVTDVERPGIEPTLGRLEHDVAGPRPRRPRVHRPVVVALVVAALLLAAAVALAASGMLTGDPVKPPPGTTFTPSRGTGVPLPGGSRLLAVRTPDPAGGPDWGLRLVKTTRGLGCIQIGRVVDGRLGVLGQDGAFGDDGRFHELPPNVLQPFMCVPLDGAGHAYLAGTSEATPASALLGGCWPKRHANMPLPLCPMGDLRALRYGLVGSQAVSVSYDDRSGRRVSQPTVGLEGAYLVVLPASPRSVQQGAFPAGVSYGPGIRLESVRYRDGHACRIRSARMIGGAKPCPPVGYVSPRHAAVTRADVAAPVHARYVHKRVPVAGTQPAVRITFRARVATKGARARYVFSMRLPRRSGACGFGVGGAFERDIRAGSVVRRTIAIPERCHGRITGTVGYRFDAGPSAAMASPPVPIPGDATVGRFSVVAP